MKTKIYKIISADDKGYLPSKIFDIIIMILIVESIISVILSTFSNIPTTISGIISNLEMLSIIIFTVEYLLRIWTSDLLYPEYGKIKSRVKYIFSFMALVDLFAILPFYLSSAMY